MTGLLEFKSDAGSAILAEVCEFPDTGPALRGGQSGSALVDAAETLAIVLGRLRPGVRAIVADPRDAVDSPDGLEMEFVVTIAAGSNMIVARTSGERAFGSR